jgi:lipopolysaccharide biosynthesis glycosyltransferase
MGPWGESLGKLNTGVMVVNAPLLDRTVFAHAGVTHAGQSYDCGDEASSALAGASARRLRLGRAAQEYNVFVNHCIGARWPQIGARAKLLHFVGPTKPWATAYERDCAFGREFKARWDDVARHVRCNSREPDRCPPPAS